MIYDVTQTTHYVYGERVPSSRHIIRMRPPETSTQKIAAFHLAIAPQPDEHREGVDFFGNPISIIRIDQPHDALDVTVQARVCVNEPEAFDPGQTPPWERIAAFAVQSTAIDAQAPVHRLFASRLVPIDPALTAYAAESFVPGRPIVDAACELNRRIKADFVYDPLATNVDTDPVHAFAMRAGVCQDFAHIMIAGMRGLGLPVGYVSGWLRTVPPPGEVRLAGADATHAWVSVWCGAQGWVGLDPTNGIFAGADHIVLAEGRDYADVAPLDGVIWSAADHSLSVAVDVLPVVDG